MCGSCRGCLWGHVQCKGGFAEALRSSVEGGLKGGELKGSFAEGSRSSVEGGLKGGKGSLWDKKLSAGNWGGQLGERELVERN